MTKIQCIKLIAACIALPFAAGADTTKIPATLKDHVNCSGVIHCGQTLTLLEMEFVTGKAYTYDEFIALPFDERARATTEGYLMWYNFRQENAALIASLR